MLWADKAMLRFLLIVSGFWFMFMQLWDLLPNFIDEWVDTRDVGSFLTSIFGDGAKSFLTVRRCGQARDPDQHRLASPSSCWCCRCPGSSAASR